MTAIEITVRGLPVPQGSARAFVRNGRAMIATEANRTSSPLGAWRTAIAQEARAAMRDAALFEGPLCVMVEFVFPRPRSHFLPANRRRPVPELRPDAPLFVATKPDVDKLERAVLDALSTVVFRDDAQVAHLDAMKLYEGEQRRPGARITVEPVGHGS